MKKTLLVIIILIPLFGIVYFAGPKPLRPVYAKAFPEITQNLSDYVDNLDKGHLIKPGNGAKILWQDSITKQQSAYAVVYLHGFSASHEEGNPIHHYTAAKLKANLFLARLADHGIDTIAPLQHFTADRLWRSGKEALAIGEKLGKKVILMGTSTGATLALKLAATYPEKVAGLILLSPNIEINDNNAFMLNDPWGLQIARQVIGGDERILTGKTPAYSKYWNTHYRLEAVVALQDLLETSMTPQTFLKVTQPTLMLYYYKNELEQDPVVKVAPMLKMFNELGTPSTLKMKEAIPDANNHVIGSHITSKDIPAVERAVDRFIPLLTRKITPTK